MKRNIVEINLIITNGDKISKAKSYSGNLGFFLKATGALDFSKRRVTRWNLYHDELSPATLSNIQ